MSKWRKILEKDGKRINNQIIFVSIIGVYLLIMLLSFVILAWWTDIAYTQPDMKDPYMMQTDAFAKGQIEIDVEPSKELLELENPYDPELRLENNVDYLVDFALYNGTYYSYFGVVPVLLVLLPFRLITGMYLSTCYFSFFLDIGASIALAFLYKTIFKKFFNRCGNLLFTFGLIATIFCSNILFLCMRYEFYDIAYSSALLLTFLSLNLLLKVRINGSHSRLYVLLSGLFFALSVGCRPTACLYFIIHIPILFSIFKGGKFDKSKIKLITFYALPIVIIACCIASYNYIRFDSFLQFGASYQLTVLDVRKYSLFDFQKVIEGFLRYLYQPVAFQNEFPYIGLTTFEFTEAANAMYSCPVLGMFGYLAMWNILLLPFVILKNIKSNNKARSLPLIGSLVICCVLMIYVVSATGGILERYVLDFQWMAILAAICTFFCFYEQYGEKSIGDKGLTIKKLAVPWFCISVIFSAYLVFGLGSHNVIRTALLFMH